MRKKGIALLALSFVCTLLLGIGLVACAPTSSGSGNGGGNEFTPPEPTMYTVTFNAHNGDTPVEVDVEENDIVEAPAPNPTWPGHTFAGWYETEAAAQAAGTPVLFPQVVKGDVTYHAGWKTAVANTAIIFILQGGTLEGEGGQSITSVAVASGETVDLSEYVPERQGYDFDGWMDDNDNIVTTVTVTADLYITAKWTALVSYSYDVTLNRAGDAPTVKAGVLVDGSVRVGGTLTLPEITDDDYDAENYDFLGYYFGNREVEEGEIDLSGYSVPTAIVIEARFDYKTYTVTFEYGNPYNEQELNRDPVRNVATTPITLTAPAFPAGTSSATHRFAGWTEEIDLDVNDILSSYAIHGNATLYAHFIAIPQITVRWAVEIDDEVKYMPDSYNATVTDGGRLTEGQIPTAGQVRRVFEGYVLTNWYVYADANRENGTILEAHGEDESAGTLGTVISMETLYVIEDGGTYYVTAYADGFDGSGMIAYRFEAETHATIVGGNLSSGSTYFEASIFGSGGAVAANLGSMNTMTYNLNAAEEVDVRIAFAVSPGNGQGGSTVRESTHYTITVNGTQVHYDDYTLPILDGYRWNAYWATAWVSVHLSAGTNTIVFNRVGNNIPNLDYLEVISPVEITAIGTQINFELGGGRFPALTREINDQGVQIQRDTVPHGTTLNVPVNVQLRTAANGQNDAFLVVGSIPTPIHESYIFNGWRIGSAEGEVLGNNTTVPAEGLTLYASWTPAQTVTFNLNAEDAEMDVDFLSFVANSVVDVSSFVPNRIGYAFMGWYTEDEDGELYTASEQAEDFTLYAHWAEAWEVYLELNDGLLYGDSTVWVAKDAEAGSFALSMPYRVGWAFDGWYISEDLTGDAINLASWVPTEDTVLYAKWVNTGVITITFRGENDSAPNGWTNTSTVQTVTVKSGTTWADVFATYSAQYATQPVTTYTRSNVTYNFSHWSTSTNGTTIADTYTFNNNANVYGVWTRA